MVRSRCGWSGCSLRAEMKRQASSAIRNRARTSGRPAPNRSSWTSNRPPWTRRRRSCAAPTQRSSQPARAPTAVRNARTRWTAARQCSSRTPRSGLAVRRYVVVSAMGADPDHPGDEVFDAYLRAKGAADAYVRSRTALDWTILRPGMLTNDAGTGQVQLSVSTGRAPVPRDDVAAALLELLDTPATAWPDAGADLGERAGDGGGEGRRGELRGRLRGSGSRGPVRR